MCVDITIGTKCRRICDIGGDRGCDRDQISTPFRSAGVLACPEYSTEHERFDRICQFGRCVVLPFSGVVREMLVNSRIESVSHGIRDKGPDWMDNFVTSRLSFDVWESRRAAVRERLFALSMYSTVFATMSPGGCTSCRTGHECPIDHESGCGSRDRALRLAPSHAL